MVNQIELNKTLTDLEKTFNVAGSIPIVAIYSSLLRGIAGKIQVIASIFFGLIGLIGEMTGSNSRYYEDMTKKAAEHIMHGTLNCIRGAVESFLATTVLGTLGLLAYHSFSSRKFMPIVPYADEAPKLDKSTV